MEDPPDNEYSYRPSLSEVGCNDDAPRRVRDETSDEKWRILLEQQNRNFLTLVQAMKTSNSNNEVRMPDFDPDKPEADARAWLSTADLCISDRQQHGAQLMVALSRALKGQASTWLSTVSFPGMTWSDFKELFINRYDCPETTASFLMNLSGSKPKDNECLASYAATLITSIMSRWNDLTTEQIAIATVLAHISQFDRRVQRLSFTTEIKTRAKLHNELKAVSFLKRRPQNNDHDGPDAKRNRPSGSQPVFKCYTCGKLGHKSANCLMRKHGLKNQINRFNNQQGDNNIKSTAKPAITCFNCHEPGHYSSNCPKRSSGHGRSDGGGPTKERRVDLCVMNLPAGSLRHSGELFSFYYDSGAECSLMKESVAGKFSGKRFFDTVTMTGIGQTSVYSTTQIMSVVEIDNISLEILFHVLPDYCLRHDIMVGCEVLSQGITVQMTCDKLTFAKSCAVNLCDIRLKDSIDFNEIDTDSSLEDKAELIGILKCFETSFINGVPTSPAATEPMHIRLKDPHKTVYRRPYRLSPNERQIVREKVDELLSANIIRPSSSPFASPILLVKKKDGSDRMCVDYRELNDNTVPDRYPLPLISDQIARLHGGHYFSSLDLASGFHQIPIESESIERTAFITPDGQYEYLTMPFGLRNAPAVFQRAIISALGELVNTYVVVYMDDVLIVASNAREALIRLQIVLNVLAKKGFSLNIKKCKFLKKKVEYLGFEVCQGEIRPNPRKIEALTALPPPDTVTQLRQFIGLASYFRQFIPKFSQIMAPLYKLTSGKGKIIWKPEYEDIRKNTISILTREPVLLIYDPDLETELHTDASAIGYGAVLMQRKEGKMHAVAYFSKRTTTAESRYHSYELETLAVVNAIKHFRHFLHGRKFVVVTDCNSLQATRKKLDLTPRVHRWWAFLQSFDFDIVYRDGKRIPHADFFSRNPLPVETVNKLQNMAIHKRVDITELGENWLLAEQQRDSEISKLVVDLKENKLPEDVAKTYELRNRIERSASKRWRGSFRRIASATIYNLSCFTHGCSTGWVSGVLGNEALTGGAWLAALPCLVALPAAPFFSVLADARGRKAGAFCICASFIISWSLAAWSGPRGVWTARVAAGAGGAGALALAPVYCAEIAPKTRGLAAMPALACSCGILFAYGAGGMLSAHALSLYMAVPPSILLVSLLWIPETPSFLISVGRIQDAARVMCWFNGSDFREDLTDVIEQQEVRIRTSEGYGRRAMQRQGSDTFQPMLKRSSGLDSNSDRRAERSACSELFCHRRSRRALFSCFVLLCAAAGSGAGAVNSFAAAVLRHSSHAVPHLNLTAYNFTLYNGTAPRALFDTSEAGSMLCGTALVLGAAVATVSVDRLGRKVLLLCSCSGIVCCLAILGVYCDPRLHIHSWYTNRLKPYRKIFSFRDKTAENLMTSFNETFILNEMINDNITNDNNNDTKAWHRISLEKVNVTDDVVWSKSEKKDEVTIWLPIIMLSMVQFLYNVGLGSVPYVLISELFSMNVRSLASSLLISWMWLSNFLLLRYYGTIAVLLGLHGTYYISAISTLIGSLYIYFLIPETKGKSQEQIEEALDTFCCKSQRDAR